MAKKRISKPLMGSPRPVRKEHKVSNTLRRLLARAVGRLSRISDHTMQIAWMPLPKPFAECEGLVELLQFRPGDWLDHEGSLDAVATLLDALRIQLKAYGEDWFPTDEELDTVAFSFSSPRWPEYLKLFCAWPMAKRLNNDVQAVEDFNHEYLFGARVRQMIKKRLCGRVSRKKLSFCNSFSYLKRVAPQVSDCYVEEAILKHETRLTSWSDELACPTETFEGDMKRVIRGLIREIFPSGFLQKSVEPTPSFSAAFNARRSSGGACNTLAGLEQSADGYCPRLAVQRLKTPNVPELLRIDWDPVLGLREYRMCPLKIDKRSATERIKCRLAAVREPCKVRIVSMGEERDYYDVLRWNRLVYRYLGHHPITALTCRPATASDVPNGKYLISGDYSAATDNLDLGWSEFVLDEMNRHGRLPFEECLKTFNGLTRHKILYEVGEKPRFRKQRNGQLMGSPVSFPVLCLVNAAVNIVYLEHVNGRKFDGYWHVPVRVNGDDCLVGTSDPAPWAAFVSACGLSPSVGKNYVHERVAVINSQCYQRIPFGSMFHEDDWEEVVALNVGLLYGKGRASTSAFGNKKLGKDTFGVASNSIGALARQLLKCVDADPNVLISAMLARNPLVFKSDRPWFLHEQLGGLGIPLPPGADVSESHRKVAAFCATRARPDQVGLMFANDGSELLQSAAQWWMEECREFLRYRGAQYVYEDTVPWQSVMDPFPLPFNHYLGSGSNEVASEIRRDTYRKIRKEALRSPLSPMSLRSCVSWTTRKVVAARV